VQLIAQNGRLLVRIEAMERYLNSEDTSGFPAETLLGPSQGLPVGTPAPEFSLEGVRGETLTLDALRAAGKPVLLMFMDPKCGPCNALLPEVGRWQREHAAALTVAVVSRGDAEANRAKANEHHIAPLLLQHQDEVSDLYKANATPSAVLVRTDGTIGSPLAAGSDAIEALIAHSTGAAPALPVVGANGHQHGPVPPAPSALRVGEPAPPLRLPDLDGETRDLADFRGSRALLLFWNPGCGFCQRMLPDLQRWEGSAGADALRLLVISTGSVQANRAQRLRAPVLLDQGFSAGRAFGVAGTPSAVLLDAEGRVASEVGVGAPGVWALVGHTPGAATGAA